MSTDSAQRVVDVKKGQTAIVPEWDRVQVKNLAPINSPAGLIGYDDKCSIFSGDAVAVVGVEGDQVLVRYSIVTDNRYSCPSGAIFFTTADEFSTMNERYRRIEDEKRKERDLVSRLLGQ